MRIETLYPNVWRYIGTILRLSKEEAEVRKQEFFMKTSFAYFKNGTFWSLDIAPTVDVPVLFFDVFSYRKLFLKDERLTVSILRYSCIW